ncbi:hypothetical protein PHET_07570 [Paragonimus heterotremus]|uniref:Protein FAM166B n=1 Tax=Paragonimus heterotremus TaxID=100268 RepID=A0A8J4SXE3_9TREM|nr:hypothetical protein PHET_07570 [Paragonimus heterotremus]
MTSIEYGGGPTLEQRRRFCNLEEGGHVPGYMGFCPQFKFRSGHSFGKETAAIASEIPYYHGPQTQKPHQLYPTVGDDKDAVVRAVFKDEVPGRMLPKSTGDNKYISGMIPGYSGDVPHANFKFGATYRQLTDECVDEFVRKYKCDEKKREELREIARIFPALRPVAVDPRVRNHMNVWTDDLIKKNTQVQPVRGPTDPPIPGYQGFIPRIETTDAGLAKRYHEAACSGLELFRTESQGHWDRLAEPVTQMNTNPVVRNTVHRLPSEKYNSSRIYRREGMIPDYEGHIHGFKFEVGKSFSNTTRDLEVCAHPFPSYGDYVKEKDLANKYLR